MNLSETFVTTVAELSAMRRQDGCLYYEFLRVPVMSAGLYELAAGAADPQSPHAEDEVYVIFNGQGRIRIADQDYPVSAGSVVFVPAGVEHRFHSIEVALSILVFFAPAESN